MESDTDVKRTPTILIVDDFDDNRQMYAEFLAYAGFQVVEASNGVEAIERAIATVPDVIVMDLSLPVLDGWEATRRLKSEPKTRHIPVVALTGHALEGHSAGAREAGCDAFLVKPCLPEKLLDMVHGILAKAAARSSVPPGVPPRP
jgi:two-component system, cell cycle response regulator DivK